ncbi:MAG: hypothetical protein KGL33_06180 [Betaproteobacteria bacterium]|jgi:hypothetical protein|nr:hypothetical protein [Betaproteobacteria bacterium]
MNRAALLDSLPPAARAMCYFKYIDAADAFISWCDGLTPSQARSRARNAARPMGSSWPDRACVVSLQDIDFQGENQDDPLEILLAREAAAAALAARDAGQRLALAAARETDTAQLADMFKITQRRAQQIKAKKIDEAEAGQGVLV